MTSERKIAANRNNAKKSTGPRSKAGLRRTRLNALRHGLAAATGSHRSNEIEEMTRALVGDAPATEFARDAAEAELDLLRIRNIRALQLSTLDGNPEATAEAYAKVSDDLLKLARYETRAYGKRKRALLAMEQSDHRSIPQLA